MLRVRDAEPDDIRPILAVYRESVATDSSYLPFLREAGEAEILAWFRLKPLLACLVVPCDGGIVGVVGLRDADPGPGAGEPGGLDLLVALSVFVLPDGHDPVVLGFPSADQACPVAELDGE